MISSYEVQSMIQQQQQSMSAGMDFNYQTSMGYTGGIGSWGMNQAPMVSPPIHSGGFSYRPRDGYGLSNQAGMGAVGMVNSTAGLASTGISLATMYGGFKGARMMGAGMGRAALAGGMAFGPAMVGGMAMTHAASNMYEGAQENQAIYSTLGQNFGHINGSSKTGRGFSRQDAKSIADFTRELQAIPEMMTSMGELNRIMGTMSQMGMMHGAKSAQDFNKRFKENINTLKEISKVMQTSMEEAVQYMAQAKQAGFHTQAGALLNTAQRSFTGGITGMNQQQLQQLQMTGSQMSFGTGGYRRSGANMALRTARQVGMANDMGILTSDHIREITGMEGAEGIGAMSEMLTGAAYRMSSSGMGTAMSIAVAEQDKSGRFTGGVDQNMVDKIRGGGIGKGELLGLARSKTRSRNSKISWGRQKDRLRSEMASAVGVEGMAMELGDLLGERGWDNPDVLNMVMQRFGVDERTASAVQVIGKNLGGIQSEIGSKAQVEGRRQAESGARGNLSGEAIKKRFYKKLENTFEEPFKKIGADMSDAVGRYVDEFMDGLLDRHSVQISRETANTVGGAMSGDVSAQKALSAMSSSLGMGSISTNPMSASTSFSDKFLETIGTTSAKSERYNFLSGLGSEFSTSKGILGTELYQTAAQEKGFRSVIGDASRGKYRDKALQTLNDIPGMTDRFKGFMARNNSTLAEMSDLERMNYIKKEFGDDLDGFDVSKEEAIATLQGKSGTGKMLGSINFENFLGERYGTSQFSDVAALGKKQAESTGALSDAFGHQSSGVRALLESDSKERDLFLKASSGDKDAHRLLTEKMSVSDKEELMRKFGIDESKLEGVRGLYGGAGGADVSGLAKGLMGDIARSSLTGEAAQLRRLGGDMRDRYGKMSDLDEAGFKGTALDSFVSKLQGIDSPNKLIKMVGEGGSMSGDVRGVLDYVRGLKGSERDKALDVLGPGARSALGGEAGLHKLIKRKGGLAELRAGGDDDLKTQIDRALSDGKVSKDEENELVKKISDRKFAGSLSQKGTVAGQELDKQRELTTELTKFVEASSKFAQIVFEGVPTLKGAKDAAGKVKEAGANVTNKK